MAWRRPGDKPLSEPMMVSLPRHICITRPQWVNYMEILEVNVYSCGTSEALLLTEINFNAGMDK